MRPVHAAFYLLAAAAMQVLQPGIDPADRMFIVGLMDYTPPSLAGVGLAGLMASIMSTASTLFVLTGFALAKDLFENILHIQMDERKGLILGRVAQVFIAVLVCIVAIMQPSTIFWISIYAGSIFAVSWMPTIIASFEWKRMNSKAAIASMTVGVISFIVLGELNKSGIIHLSPNFDHFYISMILSIIALFVIGFMTKPNEHEITFYQK